MMSFYELIALLSDILCWFLNSKCFVHIVAMFIVFLLYLLYKHRQKVKFVSINDITVFNVNVKLDSKNIDIAYMMYIQLSTRKLGMEFNNDDVIVEVYDSWYQTFGIIRDLLSVIKPTPKNKDLIDVGIRILNMSLRPHLTKWQAKFRKWYNEELSKEENRHFTPQEIQKRYPYYDELVMDLKYRHQEILNFIEILKKIFE